MKKTIKIDGMTCEHCVASVERALKSLDLVTAVNVSLKDKCAKVECDETLSDEALNEAVYDSGFDVVSIENN